MPKAAFAGEEFTIADRIGAMALMRFAKVAKGGAEAADMDGLAAMYDLLEQCLAEEEWPRFEAHADKVRADGEQLMAFVGEVMKMVTERPTSQPSDSSGGLPSTSTNSTGGSSSPVIARLERQGRADLALIVANAQESRTA